MKIIEIASKTQDVVAKNEIIYFGNAPQQPKAILIDVHVKKYVAIFLQLGTSVFNKSF